MRRFICSLIVATMSLGLSLSLASGQESEKDELNTRVHDVNNVANQHGGMKDAIHDVSVETGVSEQDLHKLHQNHPDAGAAGLLVASVLADNTKKSPEKFLNARESGKGWAAIARENDVPLDKINGKLDNLERELKGRLPATGVPNNGGNYNNYRNYLPGGSKY